jgi:hypothetical protein
VRGEKCARHSHSSLLIYPNLKVHTQGCGVAQLIVRRLAVRQARVPFSARHPMEVLLLLSEEAMRIQEDGPRRMVKDG